MIIMGKERMNQTAESVEVLNNLLDLEFEGMQRDAEKLASQLERFVLTSFDLEVRTEHENHLVMYDHDEWSCTCDFFGRNGTCVHVMAVEMLSRSMLHSAEEAHE